MKLKYTFTILFCSTVLLTSFSVLGQVGIGTTTPQGALDISSTTNGLVYPTVALNNISTRTLTNPNGANIVEGTTVYNTATSNPSVGANSVYPGLYQWDNGKWVPQFQKRDFGIFNQTLNLRTDNTSKNISFDKSQRFTPKYSGTYTILLTTHFGGGQLNRPESGNGNKQRQNLAAAKGTFTFSVSGLPTIYTYGVYAYSARNRDGLVGAEKNYLDAYNQTTYPIEVTLVAGTTYTFNLSFLQQSNSKFTSTGTSGAGQGYIFDKGNINCRVEFNYSGE